MNLETAIDLVSTLESQIQKSKGLNFIQFEYISTYKIVIRIVNFINEEYTNDYALLSLIKKFNDIKNVMACELYKKFLMLDFTKDFYINTEILANVSLIYGISYRDMLVKEFCSKALSHMNDQIVEIEEIRRIKKILDFFQKLIDSDKVDMFSDDWNISYYLYVEFKQYFAENLKKIENFKLIQIMEIAQKIRQLEMYVKEILIKKNSSFGLKSTMCDFFDENEYCANLCLNEIKQNIEKFKETLNLNFNVKYNTRLEEYEPNYKTKIQPYITALDLFSFVKKIIEHTTIISSGKIFKLTCKEIMELLKHYGTLLISNTNILEESGFTKTSEFALFSVIATCNYCMTAIDTMDTSLKLNDFGISIEKIKVFYSNKIFLKTIDMITKANVERQKKYTKKFQSLSFVSKPDNKEEERSKIINDTITEYINHVLLIYGDTTHAFIGKVLKGLDEFCFPFAFKSITFQMIDSVHQDMLGLRNVSPKYHVKLFTIFEKLIERIHSLFLDDLCKSITKYQPDVDFKLSKINKLINAISIEKEYKLEEHLKIFGEDISYETVLQIKENSNLSNIKHVSENSVTTVVKDNAEKISTFISGAFGTISRKGKC